MMQTDTQRTLPVQAVVMKKIGVSSCGTDSDCVAYATCPSGTSECTCDTASNFVAGSAGDLTCSCMTDYAVASSGTACGQGVKGATCSGDSDCIDNAVCTNGACVCDASKGYKVVAATGACTCDPSGDWTPSGTSCGKHIAQDCTSSTDCIDNAVCDLATSRCLCDSSNGYTGSLDSCGQGRKLCSSPCTGALVRVVLTRGADKQAAKVSSSLTFSSISKQNRESSNLRHGQQLGTEVRWTLRSPCADNASCDSDSGTCTCDANFDADADMVCRKS
ncbi:hypothetical protein BaRGS_00032962, partial [Batillaria attramentaria]